MKASHVEFVIWLAMFAVCVWIGMIFEPVAGVLMATAVGGCLACGVMDRRAMERRREWRR